jgi:hypothetical protein
MKTNKYNATYEIRPIKVPGDDSCFYWSFLIVSDNLKKSNIKSLREKVANFIRNWSITDDLLLFGSKYKTRAQYCEEIKKDKWGGGPELQAVALLYQMAICVVNVAHKNQPDFSVNVTVHEKDDQPFQKCVYIIYDREANHYDALCLCNTNNPNEQITIFDHHDPTVKNLLLKFIRNQLNC